MDRWLFGNMGCKPSKADPDSWHKKVGNHCEGVLRFVDDVVSFLKDPMAVMRALEERCVMKGVGKPQRHLGGDVVELGEAWHKEGICAAFSAETHVKSNMGKLATMCGKSHFADKKTPISDACHPELDGSPLLPPDDISEHKSLVGSGNWLTTLGRFDMQCAVSTMSQCSMAPRSGHMDELQRVFGCLQKHPDGKIAIDIADPPIRKDIVHATGQQWIEFHPDAEEDVPADMSEPAGMEARLTTFVDADHARNQVTRQSVTGIMMPLNNAPLVWISKRQKTAETSKHGSELVAARIAIDLVVEMRCKLRLLGVRLEDQTAMLGDDMSVVLTNTTVPSSNLKKKHLACSHHRIREAIAGKFVKFGHVRSEHNLADINTEPLGSVAFHHLIDPCLFRNPAQLRSAKGEFPDAMDLLPSEGAIEGELQSTIVRALSTTSLFEIEGELRSTIVGACQSRVLPSVVVARNVSVMSASGVGHDCRFAIHIPRLNPSVPSEITAAPGMRATSR
jgi:hypothetical protein